MRKTLAVGASLVLGATGLIGIVTATAASAATTGSVCTLRMVTNQTFFNPDGDLVDLPGHVENYQPDVSWCILDTPLASGLDSLTALRCGGGNFIFNIVEVDCPD